MLSSLWITSCKKDAQNNETGNNNTISVESGLNVININTSIDDFEEAPEPEPKTESSSLLNSNAKVNAIERQNITLANGSKLVAEVTSTSPLQKTEATITPLIDNIVYKVVVYDKASGSYVKEKNYIRGKESSDPAPLQLDEGTYTFIVYGIGGNTDVNMLPTMATPKQSLANASFTSATLGNQDLMWFKTDMKVVSSNGTSGKTNFLNVVLKHVFCQVNINIDFSAFGFKIPDYTGLNFSFLSHYPGATIKWSNGTITPSGQSITLKNNFLPVIDNVARYTALINTNVAFNSYVLGEFLLGSSEFPGNMNGMRTPYGFKRNLNINFKPSDFFLLWQGQPAAAIGEQVWMRYNLGAKPPSDPLTPFSPEWNGVGQVPKNLIGNYYRWAVLKETATPLSTNGVPVNGNPDSGSSWNSGSETAPVKATNDPCPSGYRVPTRTDYEKLISSTTNTTSSRKVIQFVSKKISDVKLTFLPGGWYDNKGNGLIAEYGNNSFFWTSTKSGADGILLKGTAFDDRTTYDSNNIRCIAENPVLARANGKKQPPIY